MSFDPCMYLTCSKGWSQSCFAILYKIRCMQITEVRCLRTFQITIWWFWTLKAICGLGLDICQGLLWEHLTVLIRNTLTSKNIQICKFISILMYLKMLCCECLYIVYLETSGYCTCVHYIKTWHYWKEKYFCFLPPYFDYDAIQIK